MATELQQPKVAELPKKTLEKSPQTPALAQRLDTSAASTPILSSQNASAVEEATKDGEEGKESKEIALSSPTSMPVSDLQKKFLRAERFGVPVQLSEKEKRNSRAERFGTATTVYGSGEQKKLEEQKRKARAERFGITSEPIVDEESKKKARLERFGKGPKPDPLEEDKRKARAARFGQASTGSSSEANGKLKKDDEKSASGGA